MLWTVVFILVFVLLGLGVVAAAMASGRRRRAADPRAERNRTRAQYVGFAVLLLGVGVAVPVLIGVNNATAQSERGPSGVDLTSAESHGQALFARNCATCHTLAATQSVGRVGPNLDQLQPPKALVLNAIKVGRAQGRGQMPAQLLTGEDAQDVASYVSTVAGR